MTVFFRWPCCLFYYIQIMSSCSYTILCVCSKYIMKFMIYADYQVIKQANFAFATVSLSDFVPPCFSFFHSFFLRISFQFRRISFFSASPTYTSTHTHTIHAYTSRESVSRIFVMLMSRTQARNDDEKSAEREKNKPFCSTSQYFVAYFCGLPIYSLTLHTVLSIISRTSSPVRCQYTIPENTKHARTKYKKVFAKF